MVLFVASAAVCQKEERKVGHATFRVVKSSGDEAVLLPLVAPEFKVHRLSGEKDLAEEIMRCEISARVMSVDEKTRVAMVATILKCKGQEYGIGEVDFALEQ